jgi:hypothetical protein
MSELQTCVLLGPYYRCQKTTSVSFRYGYLTSLLTHNNSIAGHFFHSLMSLSHDHDHGLISHICWLYSHTIQTVIPLEVKVAICVLGVL